MIFKTTNAAPKIGNAANATIYQEGVQYQKRGASKCGTVAMQRTIDSLELQKKKTVEGIQKMKTAIGCMR